MKKFNQFIKENLGKTKEEVVAEFTSKYGGDFFNEFISTFDSQSFNDKLFDYIDFDPELTDEENMEENWYPEAEVHMLQSEIEAEYPGDVWVDFHNALGDTNW